MCLLQRATADAKPRRSAVALVTGGSEPALVARIQAELAALGWRVKAVPGDRGEALVQVAKRAQTLAVVRFGPRGEGIELWVAPEPAAESQQEWIAIDAGGADVAVLRAVEALRARFLELGIEPESEPARADEPVTEVATSDDSPGRRPPARRGSAIDRAPPREVRERTRIGGPALLRSPRAVFGLSGAALRAVGAESVEAKLVFAIRLLAEPKVSASLEGWLPLNEATVGAGERSARVRSSMLGATLGYREHTGPLRWGAGVGCALALLDLRGNSSETFVGVSKSLYVALPSARLHAELPLSRRLAIRLEGVAGLARPRPRIALGAAGEYWGQPLLSAALGLEWSPFSQ